MAENRIDLNQETDDGLNLLQNLCQKLFINNPKYKDVLEDVAKLIFEKQLKEINTKLRDLPTYNGKAEVDSFKRITEEEIARKEEEYYLTGDDNILDEIDNVHEATLESEIEIRRLREDLIKECQDQAKLMMFSKSESIEPNEESKASEFKFKKGGLAEASIQCIIDCFDASNASQVYINSKVADNVVWTAAPSGLRILHEVKCVDALSKDHDLAQFKEYSAYLKNKNFAICYHFMRLFTHHKDGFDNWRAKLRKQLEDLSRESSVPVFLLYYNQPLISIKIYLDQNNKRKKCKFTSFSPLQLLQSSKYVSLNEAAQEYKFGNFLQENEGIEIARRSPLILSLASCCEENPIEVARKLKQEYGYSYWIRQPTDRESILIMICKLTKILKVEIVYEGLLVHNKIERIWIKEEDRTVFRGFSNPASNGLSIIGEHQYPEFSPDYVCKTSRLIRVKQWNKSDIFTAENYKEADDAPQDVLRLYDS